MKNNRWILGTIYALCFSVPVCVLCTCDLQKDDYSHDGPQKSYYRLEAISNGAEISIVAGFFNTERLDGLEPIESWGSNLSAKEIWKVSDEEVEGLRTGHTYSGLFVEAIKKGSDGSWPTISINHVDENGWGDVPSEAGRYANGICIAYEYFWTPPLPIPPFPHLDPPSGPPPIPGGETVICTELHRQGLMDQAIFKADEAFGRFLRDNQKEVLIGYHFWATPVVSFMQKSRVFTQIVNVLAKPWSIEMAYRIGARDEGSFSGKILMDVGVPVCRAIGRAMTWARNIGLRHGWPRVVLSAPAPAAGVPRNRD